MEKTNLRDMVVDQRVNIEPDLLAKYVESVLPAPVEKRPVTEDLLRRNGFMR
jgi:riboflavin synthase alpha subunit